MVPVSFAFTVSSSANPPDYFSAEKVDLSLGIDGGYSLPISITEHEGELAVLHRFIPEDGESYAKHYVATYDTQGNRLTLSELTGELSEKVITGIRSGSDGNILVLEPWVSETKVYRYSIPEQKVTGTVTLQFPDEYVNMENLYTDTKGQFYLTALDASGTKVFVYDAEGKLLNSEYREGVNEAAFQMGNTFYFEASVDSGQKRILYPVNIETAAFLDIVDVSEVFGNESVYPGPDYLCSMNSQGLYWFDETTNEKQTMISWEESGIDKRLLSKRLDIAVLSGDALFLIVENDYLEKDVYVLNRQSINPNAGKKVLVLASMLTDGDSFMEAAIQTFNDKNTEHKIVYKDYWSGIDYSLSWEEKVLEVERKIHLDLISGNGPDILCCPSRVMKESGLMEDLMPLIYADSNFSMEDYLPNLIEAAQDGDAIYSFPISFGLDGLAGKAAFIGEKTGWTVEEFDQMAQALPKGVVPIARFSQSDLLQEALSVPSAGFYDSDLSGECILEEEFISLLEWAKEYGVPDEIAKERRESGEEDVITNELLETDKLAVMDVDIWSVLSMEWPSSLYGHKKPLTYTGFPSPNRLGPPAILNDYAITGHCTEPEIAWTFIEFLLSEEMQ
ncbi:MAG: extracellular solute-binding protein, partial [Clostridiales bacterium]|nr:extracellular solute-binding protein [Clostridiales bacterium]